MVLQVRAALDEWISGERRPADFLADLYTDVYKDHIDFQKLKVEQQNPAGYTATLRRVYRLASWVLLRRHCHQPALSINIQWWYCYSFEWFSVVQPCCNERWDRRFRLSCAPIDFLIFVTSTPYFWLVLCLFLFHIYLTHKLVCYSLDTLFNSNIYSLFIVNLSDFEAEMPILVL